MIGLYGASTAYHSFNISPRINKILKKLDHAMIFVLIAGSYTPICTIVLGGKVGYGLLSVIWIIAILGILFKCFGSAVRNGFRLLCILLMGWLCIVAIAPIIHSLSHTSFLWLLAGGIIYTVGGVIYALKIPWFENHWKNFGLPRNLSSVCYGRQSLSYGADVSNLIFALQKLLLICFNQQKLLFSC